MDEKVKVPSPLVGQTMTAQQAMRFALQEARKGAFSVSPNPCVGCVILDSEGGFLASGYHDVYGGPHAEVHAVQKLKPEQLKGAHVYVTLEPCAHEGKTPSCAKMLAKLPVASVVYGLVDPNPLVSGQGAQILKDAGIVCERYADRYGDALEQDLNEVCEAFLHNQKHKAPFVSLKVASSLDGKIAISNGDSQWITGPESREMVHELRAMHDAVLVGAGTLRKDDPSLDIRHPRITKTNRVVILDSAGQGLHKDLKLLRSHPPDHVYWCVQKGRREELAKNQVALLNQGLQVLECEPLNGGGLDPRDVMARLWENKIHSVFVEGGGRVAGSLLAHGLVQRVFLFQAPVILGEGISWSQNLRLEKMSDRLELKGVKYQVFGPDRLITGRL